MAQAGMDQYRVAPGRPASLELNKFEVGSWVEHREDASTWRLAIVRSQQQAGGQLQYTIQLEPVEQNRHKQTGVPHADLRMACSHPECKKHALHLAALPLFCDRCRKALMSTPQQRVYFQEKEAVESGQSLRLCSTCVGSLRAELKSKGQAGLDAEVQKFTRDLPQGADRQSLVLETLEETALPQRAENSDAPILSTDIDTRWAQCAGCFKWWHWVCAMYVETQYKNGRPFYCRGCAPKHERLSDELQSLLENNDATKLTQIPMGEFIEEQARHPPTPPPPHPTLGHPARHAQSPRPPPHRAPAQVRSDLEEAKIDCTPITIRIVSSLLMNSYTPERLVEHQQALGESYPREFPYKSKALLAFQKRDGLDVCLFALYVQEYGSDCPEPNKNRVYISYLDSVRYFESEPMGHRSTVYHSILVAYLQWTRMLGFKYVHIWVQLALPLPPAAAASPPPPPHPPAPRPHPSPHPAARRLSRRRAATSTSSLRARTSSASR